MNKISNKILIYFLGVFVSLLLLVAAFVAGAIVAGRGEDAVVAPSSDTFPHSDQLSEEPGRQTEADLETEIEPTIVSAGGVLNVEWLGHDEQEEAWMSGAFVNAFTEFESAGGTTPAAFRIGFVRGGVYDGYGVNMYLFLRSGLGESFVVFYGLDSLDRSQPIVLLDRYTSTFGYGVGPSFNGGSAISALSGFIYHNENGEPLSYAFNALKDLAVFDQTASVLAFENAGEDIITDQYGRTYIYRGTGTRHDYPSKSAIGLYPIIGSTSRGDLHSIPSDDNTLQLASYAGSFFTIQEDGRLRFYDLVFSFWSTTDETPYQVLDVVWNDGTRNAEAYYRGQLGGCGFISGTHVVAPEDVGVMQPSGVLSNVVVHGPVDVSGEHYKVLLAAFRQRREMQDASEAEVAQAFIDAHAVFFYTDAFGRLIQFTSAETIPLAECGKPVIYLYPEEITDIDVKLDPKGGFSVTEPAYRDGWRVTASPDGMLTNRDDGQIYPYLFWEGRGGLYVAPEQYWVVERDDVQVFLDRTLQELGFNHVEISDFLEFWLPRMQAAPYYRIGFHGNAVMDALAPMELSKTPDTVIRVLMDYEELTEPIVPNPPQLPKTPRREGFTVTEWGGVIK